MLVNSSRNTIGDRRRMNPLMPFMSEIRAGRELQKPSKPSSVRCSPIIMPHQCISCTRNISQCLMLSCGHYCCSGCLAEVPNCPQCSVRVIHRTRSYQFDDLHHRRMSLRIRRHHVLMQRALVEYRFCLFYHSYNVGI